MTNGTAAGKFHIVFGRGEKKLLLALNLKPGSHITVMIPAVPAVVPAALPGTCLRQIFFNGNICPRYRRQSACGTGRVELGSTFQAIPVPQEDENFNGNTHRRYRQSAAGKLLIR